MKFGKVGFITKIRRRMKKFFEKKGLDKMTKDNLLIRIDEFLKRIKSPIPDFVSSTSNILDYKKWLAESFLIRDYVPYSRPADREERELLNISQNILTKSTKYRKIIERGELNGK